MIFVMIFIVLVIILMKISSEAEERKYNNLEGKVNSGKATKVDQISFFALNIKRIVFGVITLYVIFKIFF